MSRFQGYLTTVISCVVALLSFFFLPYLVIPFPDGNTNIFTGLQVIAINAQSSLSDSQSLMRSFQLLWMQPALIAGLLLIAAVQLLLSLNKRRGDIAAQRGGVWVLIVGGLILVMLLCRYFNDASSMIALSGGSTTRTVAGGSLYGPGFWGFCFGVLLAVVGGFMVVRAER